MNSDTFETILYNRFQGQSDQDLLKPINKHSFLYWDFKIFYSIETMKKLYKKYISFVPISVLKSKILNEKMITMDVFLEKIIWVRHYHLILKRFLKKCFVIYDQKILVKAKLVAKYKDKPDVLCDIKYHPTYDTYFSAAFSERFMGGKSADGTFVFRCFKEGTTQEAVANTCQYMMNPKKGRSYIINDLMSASLTSVDDLKNVMNAYAILADKWFLSKLSSILNDFIQNYLEDTIYKLNKTNSTTRLELFIQTSPYIAAYIWETNFGTEKARKILGSALNISSKNMKGFVSSSSIAELKAYLDKKKDRTRSVLDDLPEPLWNEIQTCQKRLDNAKLGVRVGLRGARYISSDEIEAANTSLKNAWKKADQWISKNKTKTNY